ncbi:MAG: hypothetical protein KGP12_06005 [Actinomycetales bacterium]|nr:hypothetical protein [Actinomycetales bacterium]
MPPDIGSPVDDWAAGVAVADPALVLPPGERRAIMDVAGPLALEQVLDLGEGHAVAVVQSADGARWTVPLTADEGGVRRSRPSDGTAERLVGLLARGRGGRHAGGLGWQGLQARVVAGERGIDVDQTNESVIVGEQVVVKWMTRLPSAGEPGSPAARLITCLADAGFADMPAPWGFLTSGDGDADGRADGQLLASAVAYLPGAEDGWDWATADLRSLVRGAITMEQACAAAERIGQITARMHASLARDGVQHASAEQARQWRDAARAELAWAVQSVTGAEGERLRGWADRIDAALDGLASLSGTPLIAVHGDLHVGQVLRARSADGLPDRMLVTDFDGNPTLPSAQRWSRQPAAVDVVSMAASLDHVGRIVQFRDSALDTGRESGRASGPDQALVREWIAQAQARFLASYRMAAKAAGIAELLDDRLLEPLRLRQELREYRYAAEHLPHWVYVPDLALTELLAAH